MDAALEAQGQQSPSEYFDDYPGPPGSGLALTGEDDARSERSIILERRGSRRFSIVDGRGNKKDVII